MAEGDVTPKGANPDRDTAAAADWYDSHPLTISGEAAPNVVGGYLLVGVKWANQYVKGFHNNQAGKATIICQTVNGATDITITLDANAYTGKLPSINKIKVSGTSDGLVCFTQKVS